MREAMAASSAPIVAVSPFVAGHAVKGPTEKFMAAVRRPSTAAGVASLYEGLISAMVVDADDPDSGPEEIQVLSCPTLMEGPEGRRGLAERVLEFAEALG
jgi:LPPG:FO 2-phospho-L-lactate transferase